MALEWSKLLTWLKPRSQLYFAVALATAILLFAPAGLLRTLGLDEVVNPHRGWFGVGLVASLSLLVASGLAWLFTNQQSSLREWWNIRRLRGFLRNLSPPEKAVLREFRDSNTTTRAFPINDGVVSGLVAKRILYQASNISMGFSFPFNLQPWAWDYLSHNPHLLD